MCSATRAISAPDAVNGLWDRIKAEEKARGRRAREAAAEPEGALAGVPAALPALTRALKLQQKASKVGFDWNDPTRRAGEDPRGGGRDRGRARCRARQAEAGAEVGDLLFAVVNLARHLDADPEAALRTTNLKFERRFAWIERALAQRGKTPGQATLAEMDALWDAAKAAE